jgi:hypothetical protein
MTRASVQTATKVGLIALIAVAACACSSTGDKDPKLEENIYPASYKTQIAGLVRRQLEDPANIRDAYVAEPVLKTSSLTTRYVACFRMNAKEDGNYSGVKEKAAFFFNGQITQIVDATPALCGGALYQPFPELQKL